MVSVGIHPRAAMPSKIRTPRRKLYDRWRHMHRRCYDTTRKDYRRYGAKGVRVDPRWWDFQNFLDDMGYPPEGLTLEREDSTLPYGPTNCKWATVTENNRNRSICVAVAKCDLDGNELSRYETIAEAVENNIGTNDSLISRCSLGKIASHAGFKWRRL